MTEDVMGVPVAYVDPTQLETLKPGVGIIVGEFSERYARTQPLYTAAQARALADAEVARQREACALADPDDATDLEVIEHFLSTSTAATSRLRAAIERLRDCPRQFISDADRAPVRDGER